MSQPRSVVIPGLGPGIHEFLPGRTKPVDTRAKPGHDDRVSGNAGDARPRRDPMAESFAFLTGRLYKLERDQLR
jgi:hypothetical protein